MARTGPLSDTSTQARAAAAAAAAQPEFGNAMMFPSGRAQWPTSLRLSSGAAAGDRRGRPGMPRPLRHWHWQHAADAMLGRARDRTHWQSDAADSPPSQIQAQVHSDSKLIDHILITTHCEIGQNNLQSLAQWLAAGPAAGDPGRLSGVT